MECGIQRTGFDLEDFLGALPNVPGDSMAVRAAACERAETAYRLLILSLGVGATMAITGGYVALRAERLAGIWEDIKVPSQQGRNRSKSLESSSPLAARISNYFLNRPFSVTAFQGRSASHGDCLPCRDRRLLHATVTLSFFLERDGGKLSPRN